MNKPEYLGDGVYASFDGFHVILTIGPSDNPIFLDQDVLRALMDYGERVFGVPVVGSIYGNCSVCGEPIDDDDTEVHTDFDGYDCHADCCPVCHEGKGANLLSHMFTTGVAIDPNWNLELLKRPEAGDGT